MNNNILSTIALTVITFVCIGLMSEVKNLKVQLAVQKTRYKDQNFEITKLQHSVRYLNDQLKLLKTKKTVTAPKKKRIRLDSTQIAHIEHVIYHELLKEHVDSSMARILIAIAKHESNNFNSGLYQKNFNLFGMTYPPKRPTTAIGHTQFLDNGNVRRFCKFNSTASSVQDMVLYLKHRGYPLNIRSPENMVRLMKSKRYFEASETLYLRAVKRHLSQLSI